MPKIEKIKVENIVKTELAVWLLFLLSNLIRLLRKLLSVCSFFKQH